MILNGTMVHLSGHGEASSWPVTEAIQGSRLAPTVENRRDWYALRTYPRHEKCVRKHLESCNVECFLPLYVKKSRWKNGCTVRVEMPLFPSYIFVETNPQNCVRVLKVPGAISIVGSSHELWTIPDDQIRILRENLQSRVWEPHEYLVAGSKVRIKSGPLTNFTGILVRKNAALRVVLVLDQIQRGVAVEVDADEVELVTKDA